MQWRLTFDVPRSFAIELGTQKVVHSGDFRPDPMHTDSHLWREPCTSLMMLKPSTVSRDFTKDFQPLNQFNFQAAFWRAVNRANTIKDATQPLPPTPAEGMASLMTPVKPAGKPFALIELLVDIAIAAIIAEVTYEEQFDKLVWVLQSKFEIAADEGFALHYHGITDEMFRKNNWFCVQWDNIGIHFSQQGIIRIYRYPDRADLKKPPVQVDEFLICSPGDLLNRHGYFWFIPIPGVGLAMYHSVVNQKADSFFTSTQSIAFKPHLIPWPSETVDGNNTMFHASKVTIGMNPYHPTQIGFQNITYPPSGTWQDGAFDPGYVPTAAPSSVVALRLPTGHGDGAVRLMGADGKTVWKPGTDRIAKVETTLTTADKRYTPFQIAYGATWDPIFATRNTTPLILSYVTIPGYGDKLTRLEWTDNSKGEFEGTANFLASSAECKHIVLRGDATWQLEYSPDGGAHWYLVNGGLAKAFSFHPRWAVGWGTYFECKCKLLDPWERMDETHQLWQTSLDAESIAKAFNNVLTCSGFTPIADADMPPTALTVNLQKPGDGHNWRYAPRIGDKARHILHLLLLYLRQQNLEYRARFDWAAATWRIESRARNLDVLWILNFHSEFRSENQRIWPLSDLECDPNPPEANVTMVDGLSSNDPATATRVPCGPIYNNDSISNVNSFDYLGRQVIELLMVPEVTDLAEVNKMNRRVFDAIAHQRFKGTATTDWFTWGLAPDVQVVVLDSEGAGICQAWIKQRTVIVENADQEVMKFELDTVWENELDA